ncbi:MAG: RDD family protein [Candidatus Nanopelagicales bacterium]
MAIPQRSPAEVTDLGLPVTGAGSLAPFGLRLLAVSIDWLAATLIVRAAFREVPAASSTSSFLVLAVFAIEVALLTWLGGASFGQRLVGLSVRGRTRRLGLLGSVVRTLLICLVIPPAVWDSDGRGLHDRAVDSVVVRRRGGPTGGRRVVGGLDPEHP